MSRLLTALCALMVAACAPLATFRPAPGLLPGRDAEVGAGAVAVSPRPFVQEGWRGAGQLWASFGATDWLLFSGVVVADTEAALGGAAARALLVRSDRFAGGVELELGWLWGALALPVAVRLFDESWLYSSPRIGTLGDEFTPGIPVGVSVRLHDGVFARVEAQVSWARFSGFERRFHVGSAIAVQP